MEDLNCEQSGQFQSAGVIEQLRALISFPGTCWCVSFFPWCLTWETNLRSLLFLMPSVMGSMLHSVCIIVCRARLYIYGIMAMSDDFVIVSAKCNIFNRNMVICLYELWLLCTHLVETPTCVWCNMIMSCTYSMHKYTINWAQTMV